MSRLRWSLFAWLVAVGCAASAQRQHDVPQIEVVFLDVGQGDAILVRSPTGATALVDAGPDDRIVDQLQTHGIDAIDLLVASHAHADHIGGMERVLATHPVRFYLDNGVPHTTVTYANVMDRLLRTEVAYLQPTARTIEVGDVAIRVLPPDSTAAEQNDRSVSLLVEYGAFRLLLTGDLETAGLQHLLSVGVPEVTVLKASHHGSRNGVTPAWMAATRPEVVVISCGRDNPYGHPDAWALRYYGVSGTRIYRTDLHGAVTVRADTTGAYVVTTAVH
jgi:beta-lactamase superfamily II metal-dependent hydrolase